MERKEFSIKALSPEDSKLSTFSCLVKLGFFSEKLRCIFRNSQSTSLFYRSQEIYFYMLNRWLLKLKYV